MSMDAMTLIDTMIVHCRDAAAAFFIAFATGYAALLMS